MKTYSVGLVGESNYLSEIRLSSVRERVSLEPEPDNPHDPRAIVARNAHGEVIGYLPRDGWLTGVILDEDKSVTAQIASIEGTGNKLGVVLLVAIGGEMPMPDFDNPPLWSQRRRQPARSSSNPVGCGMIALIIIGVLFLFSRGTADSPPPRTGAVALPTIAPALSPYQLKECRKSMRAFQRGLIRSIRRGLIVVDELSWAGLSWDNKKVIMICALSSESNGDINGIILVKGYRSGRRLAGGSPGRGTLSPD